MNWAAVSNPMLERSGRTISIIKFESQMSGGNRTRAKKRGVIAMGLKTWRRLAPSSEAPITPMSMKYLMFWFDFGVGVSRLKCFLKNR